MTVHTEELRTRLLDIGQELANLLVDGMATAGTPQTRVCTHAFLVTREVVYGEDDTIGRSDVNWMKAGPVSGWEINAMVDEAFRQIQEQQVFLEELEED